jgi:hypothetical protein
MEETGPCTFASMHEGCRPMHAMQTCRKRNAPISSFGMAPENRSAASSELAAASTGTSTGAAIWAISRPTDPSGLEVD